MRILLHHLAQKRKSSSAPLLSFSVQSSHSVPPIRGIYANRDLKKGQILFKEFPFVSILIPQDPPANKLCEICFQEPKNSGTEVEPNRILCSSDCEATANQQYQWYFNQNPRETTQYLQHYLGAPGHSRLFPILVSKLAARCLMNSNPLSINQPVLNMLNGYSHSKINDPQIQSLFDQDYARFNELITRGKFSEVFTRDWFHQMLSMLNLNSISIARNSVPIGKGFYLMASFFNHSCLPNIGADFDGSKISFTVAQDVAAGEQLFISYVNNPKWSQKEVHEFLWMHYGFKCECPLCQKVS